MNVLKAIVNDFIGFFDIRTRRGVIRVIVSVLLIIGATQVVTQLTRTEETATEPLPPTVTVTTASAVVTDDDFSLIGTVAAVEQARIQTEAAGRVTRVPVALGNTVSAGTVIAELENASAYAALLQAEGAYEAALAAAAQSEVSVDSARNALRSAEDNAVNAYRNAYTTVSDAILTTIDTFYSNPQNINFGVLIDSDGQAPTLVRERKDLSTVLSTWQTETSRLSASDDLVPALTDAQQRVVRVINLVDSFVTLTSSADPNDTLAGTPVRTYTESLLSVRSSLNGTLNTLDGSITALQNATESVRQAEIGATGNNEVSVANAQVKQALGALRAAEANYNDTIIRTPIAGTVNELALQAGDYVSVNAPVALIANNNALEITTFVGEADARRMSIGQTVLIESSIPGVVTAIAPGIDTETRKTEVKIGSESTELQTGDTVAIQFENTTDKPDETTPIRIPITAVKFTATDGSVFLVEDNTLVARPVMVGQIAGSFVTIESGLDRSTEFVVDARGLTEGLAVEPVRN